MFEYKYAYLFGSLIVLMPLWFILFKSRKDLRNEILLLSVVGGFFSILHEPFFYGIYWSPELITGTKVGLEDFLYGFFIVGIAASIYEILFRKKFVPSTSKKRNINYSFVIYSALFLLLSTWAPYKVFDLNPIYGVSIGCILLTLYILTLRQDLIIDALVSGILIGAITFLGYLLLMRIFPKLVINYWHLDKISGVLVKGVPLEEIIFAFVLGFLSGPFYEFIVGLKLRNK